ncbi:hypothetical protein FBU30_008238 [Linnemannia zychae]|nr:hypothetical protein FBU30_008238 [Linnemannia zychae]
MATLIYHFDIGSSTFGDASEGSWISAYSRGLRSMYHNDEDHCWEAILCTQPCSPYSSFMSESAGQHEYHQPAQQSNSHHHRHAHHSNQTLEADYFSDRAGLDSTSRTDYEDSVLSEADVNAQLAPTSPGSGLSRALCNIGFSCIDFVTGDILSSSVSSSIKLVSHVPRSKVDSKHIHISENNQEADSTIMMEQKKTFSWARRVWHAL